MSTAERYRAAGVDLEAAHRVKGGIAAALAATRTPLALGTVGAFGGMVRVPPDITRPVLVTSTDGVGTKVLVAIRAGRHETIGEDLVNHCVNDVLVHGARPIAFLDYIAAASVEPDTVAAIVEGVARGCRAHDMTLTGGETAELPDLYQPGHYDLAGTIIGVAPEDAILHGDVIRPGDILLGYASSGLHTNGYTLARRVIFDELRLEVGSYVSDLERTVGDVLLDVHRSYAPAVAPALSRIHGLAHITGGGIAGNLVRILPAGCGARIATASWVPPPVFPWLQAAGQISTPEMYEVFNMGVGMIAVAPSSAADELGRVATAANVTTFVIGQVVEGDGVQLD